MSKSIWINNYNGGSPYQEQIFLNMIQNLFYDGATYVNVLTIGNSTAHQIKPTDATDAAAIINQINAAYKSIADQVVITGSPSAPDTPTNLAAAADYGVIVISWTAVAGNGITYNVYRGASGGETLHQSGITGTTFNDTVAAGPSYYYRVSAVNARGEGSLAAEVGPYTSSVPTTPTLNSATADYNAIDMAWTTVTGSSNFPTVNYNIYVDAVKTYTVSAITAQITSVVGSHTYTVSAVINGIEGSQSAGITRAPLTLAAPTASAAVGYYGFTITWPAVTGAQQYNLYRGVSGGFVLIAGGITGLTYTDISLSYETSYSYKVSAFANGIEGPLSTGTAPTNPNQVSGMAAHPNTLLASSGGIVQFTGTGFNSNQSGQIAYGIGSVSYLGVVYNGDGSISATFPAGLSTGTVNCYYVVNGDLNPSTTVNTQLTFD